MSCSVAVFLIPLRQGLSLNRLWDDGRQVPVIVLSVCYYVGVTNTYGHAWLFNVRAVDSNSGFHDYIEKALT